MEELVLKYGSEKVKCMVNKILHQQVLHQKRNQPVLQEVKADLEAVVVVDNIYLNNINF